MWDQDVPLHEWKEPKEAPNTVADLTTWVFEEESFTPIAKLQEDARYSIVCDHLGTPTQLYNEKGKLTWKAELDSYGCIRQLTAGHQADCPFRFPGQYEDVETGLCYNRFR